MTTKVHGTRPAKNAKPAKPQAKPGVERASLPGERAETEGMIAPAERPAPEPTRVKPASEAIEGEGSYSATHRYDAGVARSVAEGDTERLAEEAAKALDGPEGAELRKAEQTAKHGHR